MGNSTSNAANPNSTSNHSQLQPSSSRYASPTRRTQSPISRGGSPVPAANRVHKSLRNKKKSLELPDLASLALTPASNSPGSSPHASYRRPRASSPIPIPISPNNAPSTFRVQNNLPSAAHIALSQNGRASRYRSYLSSAYPSTHSFVSRDQEQGSPPRQEPVKHEFVPEVVHSTIPLALPKAEGEVHKPEHLTVTIKWRGGGKSVILARAGDDYWKGRQPMEYECVSQLCHFSCSPRPHHCCWQYCDVSTGSQDVGHCIIFSLAHRCSARSILSTGDGISSARIFLFESSCSPCYSPPFLYLGQERCFSAQTGCASVAPEHFAMCLRVQPLVHSLRLSHFCF